ncbi:MAG TPA: hypothetical protein VFG22_10495 [Polyangiales bacterium]|nr:hypothetical protein [Polyangiales bacterium]
MSYDWRNDPASYYEWERRNRALIIVPAAPIETDYEKARKYEPALWDIDSDIGPAKGPARIN